MFLASRQHARLHMGDSSSNEKSQHMRQCVDSIQLCWHFLSKPCNTKHGRSLVCGKIKEVLVYWTLMFTGSIVRYITFFWCSNFTYCFKLLNSHLVLFQNISFVCQEGKKLLHKIEKLMTFDSETNYVPFLHCWKRKPTGEIKWPIKL